MNAIEMQYAFENRVGQIDVFENRRFDSDRIQDLLNITQEQKFYDLYSKYYGSSATKFEFTEKLRRELSNLISSFETTSFSSDIDDLFDNTVVVDLPSDFLYTITESCVVEKNGETGISKVTPITYDEARENIDNPFLKPTDEFIWRLDFGYSGVTGAKKHELVGNDSITIQQYSVRYLRRPQNIIIHPTNYKNCELDSSLHNEIVNMAVKMALGISGDQQDRNEQKE